LNIIKAVTTDSYVYLIMNFIGALLAGLASVLIHYLPFVILESVWTLVSLFGIIKKLITSGKE